MKILEKICELLDIMILDSDDLDSYVIEEMVDEEKEETTRKIQHTIAAVLFGISGVLCMRLAFVSDGYIVMIYAIGAAGMFGGALSALRGFMIDLFLY